MTPAIQFRPCKGCGRLLGPMAYQNAVPEGTCPGCREYVRALGMLNARLRKAREKQDYFARQAATAREAVTDLKDQLGALMRRHQSYLAALADEQRQRREARSSRQQSAA